ncbi:MAG: c-type cytochrome [Rhizomicrobium sp.]
MTKSGRLCALAGVMLLLSAVRAGVAADASDPPPAWAFPVNTPGPSAGSQNPKAIKHVAGSTRAYSGAELDNPYFPVDWFPREHPPMPAVVARGVANSVPACGFCHEATGLGGPESAALAGLPASYIVEQVGEMRAGRRRIAQAKMLAPHGMEDEARKVDTADLQAAAAYFSRLPFRSRIRVIETDVVPKTSVQGVSVYAKAPGGGTEPLGRRIVEIPQDFADWSFGNPHGTYLAYVPKGSVRRGAALVSSVDGAAPCRTCHGADLKGTGTVPGLAGRSPSYLARQLYDIEHGTRKGPAVALMLPEVAHITPADRIAIVAYLASLGS